MPPRPVYPFLRQSLTAFLICTLAASLYDFGDAVRSDIEIRRFIGGHMVFPFFHPDCPDSPGHKAQGKIWPQQKVTR